MTCRLPAFCRRLPRTILFPCSICEGMGAWVRRFNYGIEHSSTILLLAEKGFFWGSISRIKSISRIGIFGLFGTDFLKLSFVKLTNASKVIASFAHQILPLIDDGTLPPNGTLLQKFPDGSVAQKAVLFEEQGKLLCYACQQCLSFQDEKKVWSVKRSSVVDSWGSQIQNRKSGTKRYSNTR